MLPSYGICQTKQITDTSIICMVLVQAKAIHVNCNFFNDQVTIIGVGFYYRHYCNKTV